MALRWSLHLEYCLAVSLIVGGAAARADEPAPLRVGDFIERLALRSKAGVPHALSLGGDKPLVQVALVIDATTTMELEIRSLEKHLSDLGTVFAKGANGKVREVEWSIVLYRDVEASSTVLLLEPANRNLDKLIGKLETVKAETPEPFAQNLVDQGVHEALDKIAWKKEGESEKHLIIIGDSPAYGGSSKSRKHQTADLVKLAKEKGVRIHAIHPATVAIDAASAGEVRRLTQAFYRSLTSACGGINLDLADAGQAAKCLGYAVRLDGVEPLSASVVASAAPAPKDDPLYGLIKDYELQDPDDQLKFLNLIRKIEGFSLPQGDAKSAEELQTNIRELDDKVKPAPGGAPLHLHLVAAYDRLAGFETYNSAAEKRSLHAWQAKQAGVALQKPSESINLEIDANYLLHVEQRFSDALVLFERLAESKDETGNPGSGIRGRIACVRILFRLNSQAGNSDEVAKREERIRDHVKALFRDAPNSTFVKAIHSQLRPDADKNAWLHEDQIHGIY